MLTVVSGIQATNNLTLGNYIGAIKAFMDLKKKNNLIIFIADYHSITNSFDPEKLKKMRLDVAKIYYACNIFGENSIVFNQSDVAEHVELGWILMCHTNLGQLKRMTQFKDKSQRKENNGTFRIPTGLLIYPVLMAADILIYSPDIVPVGSDQKQHLELTRDIAINFNSKYKGDFFKIPEFYSKDGGEKIRDLKNPEIKMSKSNLKKDGVIFILETLEITRKKILKAKTDSLNIIKFDMENQPGISNLINIYSSLTFLKIEEVEKKFFEFNYKDFKEIVANTVCQEIKKIQEKYKMISDDKILHLLDEGAKKAASIAKNKLKEIKKIIGLKNEWR